MRKTPILTFQQSQQVTFRPHNISVLETLFPRLERRTVPPDSERTSTFSAPTDDCEVLTGSFRVITYPLTGLNNITRYIHQRYTIVSRIFLGDKIQDTLLNFWSQKNVNWIINYTPRSKRQIYHCLSILSFVFEPLRQNIW